MDIKIAVLTGSNGKWYCVPYDGEDTDWDHCRECIGNFDAAEAKDYYPDQEVRMILVAHAKFPKTKPEEIEPERVELVE